MSIAQHIQKAQIIVLTTHRQCDGDGLGCELALYYALKKVGKTVSVINVDSTPKKYRFLSPDNHIQYFDKNPNLPSKIDLVLIFDTNDERLVEPLFSKLKATGAQILFIDHHPLLTNGPRPDFQSFIKMEAASTGEVVFDLLQLLKIPLDTNIARALYTSVTFDTQLYRFIRNSPKSHLVAAELLKFPINAEEIHRHLFSHQTVNKIAFMAKLFANIEYYANGSLACVIMSVKDMEKFQLDFDEVRDVTDQIMSIDSIEVALVIRQDSPNQMKVSLRSKGIIEVLSTAETIGGGGHWYASGGSYQGDLEDLKKSLILDLENKILAAKDKIKIP
jgi:phosphoesterase RecJ-like protein